GRGVARRARVPGERAHVGAGVAVVVLARLPAQVLDPVRELALVVDRSRERRDREGEVPAVELERAQDDVALAELLLLPDDPLVELELELLRELLAALVPGRLGHGVEVTRPERLVAEALVVLLLVLQADLGRA